MKKTIECDLLRTEIVSARGYVKITQTDKVTSIKHKVILDDDALTELAIILKEKGLI